MNKEALFTSARTEKEDSRDQWLTPLWLFDLLNQEFKFDLDPAATIDNTLCDRWFTKVDDGLSQPWIAESVFVNPPYSQMKKWVEKSYHEVNFRNTDRVVMLVAARTDTKAWWNYIRWGEVRFLKGRLKFEHPNGAKYSAPFPSAVVIFGNDIKEKTIYWEVSEPK